MSVTSSTEKQTGAWSEDPDATIYCEDQFTLPGMGEPEDRCGEYTPKEFCDGEDPHLHFGEHLCGRRDCPRCWSSQWAKPRTVNAVTRLGAARHAADEPAAKRAVHVVLSPPEGSVQSIDGFYRARREAVEKAREHGIRGGLIIPHGYRVYDDTQSAYQAAKDAGREVAESGLWQFIRQNDKNWREQVYWSPHFHVVGLARDVDAGDGTDGWVLHNVERNGSHSLAPFYLHNQDGYEDMARVVRYLLSHATYEEDSTRQVMTWFGSLHGTNFDPETEITATAWSRIQQTAEQVVGTEREGEQGPDGSQDEPETCPVEGCDGHLRSIYLAQRFTAQEQNRLSIEQSYRLDLAYRIATGRHPWPTSLEDASTEKEARETFETIVQDCEGVPPLANE